MFTLQSLVLRPNPGLGCRDWIVEAIVTLPAKEWTKLRDQGQLGMLYGVDISNHIHRLNHDIPAHCPTVGDQGRASKGLKTISLSYYVRNPDQAERLGAKVMRFKSGVFFNSYGDYVDLMSKRGLNLVKAVSRE